MPLVALEKAAYQVAAPKPVPVEVSGFYIAKQSTLTETLAEASDPETLSMDIVVASSRLWVQFVRNPVQSNVPLYYPCVADNSISSLVDREDTMQRVIDDLCAALDQSQSFAASRSMVSRKIDTWHIIQNPYRTTSAPKVLELLVLDEFNNPVAGFGTYEGVIEWCVFTAISQAEMERIVQLKHEWSLTRKV